MRGAEKMYRSILKKDLKRKKTMNLILFIFIILAATFVGSSVNNLVSISTALDSYFEKAEIPDYWIAITSQSECDRFYEFAEENEYDHKTLELLQIDPNDIACNGEKFAYTNTTSISTLKNSTKVFDSSDKEITEVNDGEIYVTAEVLNNEKYGLNVGDIITISVNEKIKEFVLKDSIKDAAFGSPMVGMTRMLVSENDFAFLHNVSHCSIYSIFAYIDDAEFIDKFNELEINTIFMLDGLSFKNLYIMDMLIAGVILIVSVCLILISMVILRFTINFTMSEEFREIGVMKAIGIKSNKIRGIYIVKYLAISSIGSMIGFALSIPFGKLLIKDASRNIILSSSGGIWLNLICAALSGIIVVAFCYFCTRKIKKFSPIDAIRNGENGERYTRKGWIHLSKTHLSPVSFMAINDIFSGFKRFLAMIVIFALGLLLILIPVNTINTLKSDNLIMWFNMAKCDHVIALETLFNNNKNNKEMVNEKLDDIRTFLNENDIQADVFQEIMFKMNISHGDKKTSSIAFQGNGSITADEYMYDEGTAPKNIHEIAIASQVAERIDVQIGDDVMIKNGDTSKTYTVCAMYQSMNNMGEGIRFHQDEELDYDYAGGSFGIQIRYRDNPDNNMLSERKNMLADKYTNGKVYTPGEYVNYMIGDIAGQIDSIKMLILSIVLCINILVTVLMVKSFITKEKNEIAMLKAIGFKNSSLIAWQTIRIGIVIFISMIFAAALSVPLTNLTIEPIFHIMGAKSIEFEIKPLEVFLIYPIIVLIVTTLSGMLTSLQVRRISASETSNIE